MAFNETPPQRLQRFIDEDRLIRKKWGDGYARACLLAALDPRVAELRTVTACSAALIKPWLAHMTPSIDDNGSAEAWPAMVRRYAAVIARVHILDDAAWERARLRSLHFSVSEARSYVPTRETRALEAIDAVLQWLDDGAPEDQRETVNAAARRAVRSATVLVVRTAAWAAVEAAEQAVETALLTVATQAAGVAAQALLTTMMEAAQKTWDRTTAATLAALEAECNAAEAA